MFSIFLTSNIYPDKEILFSNSFYHDRDNIIEHGIFATHVRDICQVTASKMDFRIPEIRLSVFSNGDLGFDRVMLDEARKNRKKSKTD